MLVDGPTEHDAFAAVLVVRLEHQPLAVSDDEVAEVDHLARVRRVAFADLPRPRDVLRDRGALRRGVQRGVAIVGEKGEAHLLVKELGAEAVDDGHGSLEIRLDQRLRDLILRKELARQHTSIHEVDGLALRAEAGIAERKRLLRRVEVKLTPEVLVLEQRALEPTERRVNGLRRFVNGRVLPVADEVRPQRDAEGPIAEDEPAFPLPFGEHRRAYLSEPWILQELVVRDDRVARRDRASPS